MCRYIINFYTTVENRLFLIESLELSKVRLVEKLFAQILFHSDAPFCQNFLKINFLYSGFNCWEVWGARALVILVFRERIWNVSAVSLILPTFDDTGFLGSPSRRMVYLHGFHRG